ncbi:hypothetical protein J6590_082502 [Homalodisca vitripennis]|nr:hypothetical protein J6590_082502 [Homalodisca vitripennis]
MKCCQTLMMRRSEDLSELSENEKVARPFMEERLKKPISKDLAEGIQKALSLDRKNPVPCVLSNRPKQARCSFYQRRFIRLFGVRLGFNYMEVPVRALSSELNLPSLALGRDVADVVLLLKIINGLIQCPDSRDLLSLRYHLTNSDFNSPLARLVRLGNLVAAECDLFFDRIPQIRSRAFRILSISDI